MQLPIQALGKRKMLIIRKRLIPKHQNAIFIHAGSNLSQRFRGVYLAQINWVYFSNKIGV
jgi:hypothetical protein